jgi:hypothetical protein
VIGPARLGALLDLYAECLRNYPEACYHGRVAASA